MTAFDLEAPAYGKLISSLPNGVAARLLRLVRKPSEGRLALMLYGSHARYTADEDSDIDVLELVASGARSYDFLGINVNQYLPSHLKGMSAAGSLFVLHLRLEGRVLQDNFGVLGRSLGVYRPPRDYSMLRSELQAVACATDLRAQELNKYRDAAFRLGVFTLRTLAYIDCVEQGNPCFDLVEASLRLNRPHLRWIASKKRSTGIEDSDLRLIRTQLQEEFKADCFNPCRSIEAYAVHLGDRPYSAALVASMLRSKEGLPLPYESLALPPL